MKRGSKHSPESLKKMSAAHSGHKRNLGSKRSEESRARMSKAAKARWKKAGTSLQHLYGDRIPRLEREEKAARAKSRERMRQMIRRILRMPRSKAGKSYESLLGYDKATLRLWVESQFREGMSWDARESFHIDHKIPVAEFFRHGITDPRIICALPNLQVLSPIENRLKSDSYDSDNFNADLSELLIQIADGTNFPRNEFLVAKRVNGRTVYEVMQ